MSTEMIEAPAPLDRIGEFARALRVEAIDMTERAGSGHPTSSMSAAELIAVLVGRHFTIDPVHPATPGNDRLVFSKGHASPLLYAALRALGLLDDIVDDDRWSSYRRGGSPLEGHPTPKVPGVQIATGSLGLGLPAGVGLALAARDLDRTTGRVWVLCGDSELAEGSMWEAIEHAGWSQLSNLTAIVDVNRLGQTGPTRHEWDLEAYASRFSAFGWHTVTVDGHDIGAIDEAYRAAESAGLPTAVIARTTKGRGAAEVEDQEGKHGKPLGDPESAIESLGGRQLVRIRPMTPAAASERTGMSGRVTPQLPSWEPGDELATRDAFGEGIVALGAARGDVVALDGEVGDSTRLQAFSGEFPERFFQMFIAEQLMISVAVGMQVTGWRPFAATFAAFATRAHDVLRMATVSGADLSLVGSHAGVHIGQDGPSQMGLEDLAMMRSLHGSTVLYPCDANQTVWLTAMMADLAGVSYLRTTRDDTPVIYPPGTEFAVGGSAVLRESPDDDVALVGAGITVHEALAAADRLADEDGVTARVIDAYSIQPIDGETLARAATDTGRLVVIEDHRRAGGLGEAVLGALAERDVLHAVRHLRHLAVDHMPGSASPAEQLREAGIDAEAIVAAVRELNG